jgi:hypothetical protein
MAMLFSSTNYCDTVGTYTAYGTCTVMAWCYFNAYNTVANPFLSNRIFGSDDNWEIRICTDWSSGVWKFANELYASSNQVPCISNTTIALNTWYHLCATLSSSGAGGPGSVAQVYVNGVLENTKTYTATDTQSSNVMGIGSRTTAISGQSTNGILDDLRVYNRVLSAGEIQTIYNCQGSDHIWYGLVNKWLLNEGPSGTTVPTSGTPVKDIVSPPFHANGMTATPPSWTTSFLKWRGRR